MRDGRLSAAALSPAARYGVDMNAALRVLLVIWTLLFLAIACAPLYVDSGAIGAIGFLTGGILLVPWIVGVAILGVLIALTNPRRR